MHPPGKPSRSPHISPSVHTTKAMGTAGHIPPDADSSYFRSGSFSPNPGVVGGGVIAPPGGRPAMTLVRPSYQEACSARDESRSRFERHDPGLQLSESTVRGDTEHLGRTVVTVRNYLNATITASENDSQVDDLNTMFQSAAVHGGDITEPLQKLETLLNKTAQMLMSMSADDPDATAMQDPSDLITQARSQLFEALDPNTGFHQRCNTSLNALRSIGAAKHAMLDHLEEHMQEAEAKYHDMATGIMPKPAHLLLAESTPILRCLDHVLQNGSGATAAPPQFDIDGFVQLLYKNQALGSTISSAASRYSVSGPEMRDFVGNIPDTVTQQTAHEVATEMFGSRDHIDLGAYLREILSRTPEPRRQTAYEAFCEAMKHMRPITRGDADIHGTP